MPDNRKRNITLTIRLTPGEKDTIVQKAKQANMTLTDFVVAAVLSGQIYVAEDTKPLLTELKRIGNNLNQITARINTGVFRSYNFQEVIDLQRKIYEQLCRIGGRDRWRP